MIDTIEPITHPLGALVPIFTLLTVTFTMPWPRKMFPYLAKMGFGYLEEWEPVEVIDGVPEWALTFILMNLVCTILLMVQCVFFWRKKVSGAVPLISRKRVIYSNLSFCLYRRYLVTTGTKSVRGLGSRTLSSAVATRPRYLPHHS